MVAHVMASDQRIGMIQPLDTGQRPELFQLGCIGRIVDIEALSDGRYNIVLEGEARFRVVRELDVATPFRQVLALPLLPEEDDPGHLAAVERASLEAEARRFAEQLGYVVDWEQVGRLDDETLVHAMGQVAPFDVAAKQALLEANSLSERAELMVQLMRFFGAGDREGPATLQ